MKDIDDRKCKGGSDKITSSDALGMVFFICGIAVAALILIDSTVAVYKLGFTELDRFNMLVSQLNSMIKHEIAYIMFAYVLRLIISIVDEESSMTIAKGLLKFSFGYLAYIAVMCLTYYVCRVDMAVISVGVILGIILVVILILLVAENAVVDEGDNK